MVRISEIRPSMNGRDDDDFRPMGDLADSGLEISIKQVETFSNDSGPGVIVDFSYRDIDGATRDAFTITHAVVVVDLLTSAKATEALGAGETIDCKVVRRDSTKTPGRKLFVLE